MASTPPPPRSPDDRRPGWYIAFEQAFEVLLRVVGWSVWLWGLCIFLLVLYGFWLLLFSPVDP